MNAMSNTEAQERLPFKQAVIELDQLDQAVTKHHDECVEPLEQIYKQERAAFLAALPHVEVAYQGHDGLRTLTTASELHGDIAREFCESFTDRQNPMVVAHRKFRAARLRRRRAIKQFDRQHPFQKAIDDNNVLNAEFGAAHWAMKKSLVGSLGEMREKYTLIESLEDDCEVEDVLRDIGDLLQFGGRNDAAWTAAKEARPERAVWDAALAEYHQLRAFSDSLPEDDPREDAAMDAYADARVHLACLPAPDAMALAVRRQMMLDNFEGQAGDLPIQDIDALIADAARLGTEPDHLSPAMIDVISEWKVAAKAYSAACSDEKPEEELNRLSNATHDASRTLAAFRAQTMEDLAVKMYLLALVECGQVGPGALVHDVDPQGADYEETHLWRGIISDLPRMSAAVRNLIGTDA